MLAHRLPLTRPRAFTAVVVIFGSAGCTSMRPAQQPQADAEGPVVQALLNHYAVSSAWCFATQRQAMGKEIDDLTRTDYGVARFAAPDRQTWAFWTQSDSERPNIELVVSRLGVVPPATVGSRVSAQTATYGLRFLDPRHVNRDELQVAPQPGQHHPGTEVLQGTTEDDRRIGFVIEVESGRLQALDLPGGETRLRFFDEHPIEPDQPCQFEQFPVLVVTEAGGSWTGPDIASGVRELAQEEAAPREGFRIACGKSTCVAGWEVCCRDAYGIEGRCLSRQSSSAEAMQRACRQFDRDLGYLAECDTRDDCPRGQLCCKALDDNGQLSHSCRDGCEEGTAGEAGD